MGSSSRPGFLAIEQDADIALAPCRYSRGLPDEHSAFPPNWLGPLMQWLESMTRHGCILRLPFALIVVGCLASCATSQGPIGRISGINVGKSGSDSEGAGCEGFVVTPRYVRTFLRRAVVISQRDAHDYFMHGPCYVQGTLSTKYGEWLWEIRNFGTARLTSASGDESLLLADPKEESSLGVE
jgi:hypothetical protein